MKEQPARLDPLNILSPDVLQVFVSVSLVCWVFGNSSNTYIHQITFWLVTLAERHVQVMMMLSVVSSLS
jgi:hypothetical protein